MKRVVALFSLACGIAAVLAIVFAMVFPAFTQLPDVSDVSRIPVVAPVDDLSEQRDVSGISEPHEESVPNPEKYSFIWMTDTQYYSKYYPEIQTSMIDWAIENAEELCVKALFHTGDIIHNYDEPEQWERAEKEYSRLDGVLDHMILAGNHDVGFSAVDYSFYFSHIGDGGKIVPQGNGGIYNNGKGQYLLYTTEMRRFIFIGFAWNLSEGMIDWANGLLERYSDYTAVILTHSYLNTDGTLTANGTRLFDEVVSGNPNVRLVLCGHNHSAIRVDTEIGSRTVTQLLADYQDEPEGGNGYLRILTVDEETMTVSVKTYSPYLDDYNYYEDGIDEFVIDLKE